MTNRRIRLGMHVAHCDSNLAHWGANSACNAQNPPIQVRFAISEEWIGNPSSLHDSYKVEPAPAPTLHARVDVPSEQGRSDGRTMCQEFVWNAFLNVGACRDGERLPNAGSRKDAQSDWRIARERFRQHRGGIGNRCGRLCFCVKAYPSL